jgi:hypothetical protein
MLAFLVASQIYDWLWRLTCGLWPHLCVIYIGIGLLVVVNGEKFGFVYKQHRIRRGPLNSLTFGRKGWPFAVSTFSFVCFGFVFVQ